MIQMATLPNGTPIDMDMLEIAMEDADLGNRYFLNMITGEEVFFSDYLGLSEEDERLSEEIDGSNEYVWTEPLRPDNDRSQLLRNMVDWKRSRRRRCKNESTAANSNWMWCVK